MKKQKILSILSLGIVSFIAIIVLHQPSLAENLPLNRYKNLNLYSLATNNNKQFSSNNLEKLTFELVANNLRLPAKDFVKIGFKSVLKKLFRKAVEEFIKNINIILSFLRDNWLWIGGLCIIISLIVEFINRS